MPVLTSLVKAGDEQRLIAQSESRFVSCSRTALYYLRVLASLAPLPSNHVDRGMISLQTHVPVRLAHRTLPFSFSFFL